MRQKRDSSSESYGLSCFLCGVFEIDMLFYISVYRYSSSVYDKESVVTYEWN